MTLGATLEVTAAFSGAASNRVSISRPEFRISTSRQWRQRGVAAFVVTASADGVDGGVTRHNTFARRFPSNGMALGSEFEVKTTRPTCRGWAVDGASAPPSSGTATRRCTLNGKESR